MGKLTSLSVPVLAFCLLGLLAQAALVSAQAESPKWNTEGPFVETLSFSIELPLEVLATKLYVQVEMDGKPRRFVFDTGSPSMVSASLAVELGLEPVGESKGRDAHGVLVESEIVQADLVLDGVAFHKVPMFAADFSGSETAECLVGDGVLGSELLPLCAWQIDLPAAVLRCNSDLKSLDHVRGAKKLRLHDFGYPHIPYFDVQLAKKAESKAMFDTGAPAYLTISPPDLEGTKRAGGIERTVSGYGSAGASLGGQAPVREQVRAELRTLSIGPVGLGRVEATARETAPSLLGAKLLEHFVVTLDPRSESAYFDEYRGGPFLQPSFGFALSFDDGVAVSLVWEESPAAHAGLRVGQRLTSVQGRPTGSSCEAIQRTLRSMTGETVELEWDGGAAKLSRDAGSTPR